MCVIRVEKVFRGFVKVLEEQIARGNLERACEKCCSQSKAGGGEPF